MGNLTNDFSKEEFACPCCGECKMDADFLILNQQFRTRLGIPYSPVKGGGYRCAEYNGSETGPHVEGKAVDPNFPREHYHRALQLAFEMGFTGIGVKQKKGKFQLHLDTAKAIKGVRPRPWVWTY